MSTTSQEQIKIIETPRDGMQGVKEFIPTYKKIEFINLLLQCGFDTVRWEVLCRQEPFLR
jgi:hydroxymethylglutaryl-CoA lyase